MLDYIVKGIINIRRSKAKAFLTMASISIGTFSVVVISSVSVIGTDEINRQLGTMGINSVMVSADSNEDAHMTEADANILKNINGVDDAMPLMASVTNGKIIKDTVNCMVWGVDKSAYKIISLEAKYGRLINNGDVNAKRKVCVIDEAVAINSYGRGNIVGKTIKIYLGGVYHDFKIIGVASSGISVLQNMLAEVIPNFIYTPYTTMQQLCGRHTFDRIALQLNPAESNDNTVALISDKLNSVKGTENAFKVDNLLKQKDNLNYILSVVTIALTSIAGISLLVSGLSVVTTMLVNVKERTREIGIKKSIGAKNSDILAEFLLESALLTFIGSFIGVASGLIAAAVACVALGIAFSINIMFIAAALFFSVILGVIFGVYPALRAANLCPVNALQDITG